MDVCDQSVGSGSPSRQDNQAGPLTIPNKKKGGGTPDKSPIGKLSMYTSVVTIRMSAM
ncbi:hypothetical protein M404DRAFT_262970 [Pisolithus tinctorius Marx 270]|uniref:Uncharacterized protein n=1 Tax=Pisolithus tinctorius Marx 270 TaxID=870435 RepID=A0A0C3P7L9_PISTI|nr:hypothetical protein M404DRAFT_262970 [Pisolithus tinctorius Marx 270]